jgi:Plant Basic Secretory Protein.
MKHSILSVLVFLILSYGCQAATVNNVPELLDGDLTTSYIGNKGKNQLVFDVFFNTPVLSYSLYSADDLPVYDPSDWELKGSDDGEKWTTVDKRKNQIFCSRFQEVTYMVQNPQTFKIYKLEVTAFKKGILKISEVVLSDKNLLAGWENFNYLNVRFESLNPDTEGSKLYLKLVQDPNEYIKYHARKVAEILYYSTDDPINEVRNIRYTLEDKEGISAKGGNTPNIHIFYSTRHIENSAKESLYKMDFETRGVLYHELTHGYQYEPKGCGNYGNNKTFWACIEGIADAVRAEAGYFDMSTRRPGGNWLDGYRTTGFFIQWMKTKDPNAIRKFHHTAAELEVWSFDAAVKSVFGPEASIEGMWDEYQQFLINDKE